MEVCAYPCPEQESNSLISQFGPHSHEAMQIASGQIIWPVLPKPKEDFPKLEPGFQQSLPFVDASGALHLDSENADLASRGSDIPTEKCKVRKRRLASEDGEALDGDASNEKQSIMRWKDVWVAQLIDIKGQTALSGPQKQRVDVWQVIKSEMARTCHGFDKDSEACRKKWRRVYKEYKDDKCLRLAGNGLQKCKFYDLMDFYMGDKTSGTSDSQLTAVGYNVMGPVKDEHVTNENGEAIGMDTTIYMPGAAQPASLNGEARATKRPYRRVKDQVTASESAGSALVSNSLPSLISELVGIGKEMLEMTRHYEQGKIDALHLMKETLREITKEI